MSALEPVILSEVKAVGKAVSDQSKNMALVEVGMMTHLPSEEPVITVGERVFLRSGVAVPRSSYPDFPSDAPQSAVGAVWAKVGVSDAWAASGIAYGNGMFVIVYSNAAKVKVSEDDGKTWATYGIGAACTGICFANGVFVATRTGVNSNIFRSTDGKVWSSRNLPGTIDQVGIAFGNGKFVVISKTYSYAFSSVDGLNWISSTLPQTGYLGVAFGNGVFVAIGASRAIAYSQDGVAWSQSAISSSASWTTATISFGNGMFMAASGGAAEVAVSIDGVSWVASTSPGVALKVCFAKNRFYLATAAAQWSSVTAGKWVRNPQDIPQLGNGAVFSAACASAASIVAVFNTSVAYVYRSGEVIGAADYQQYLYLRVK